MVKKVSHNKVFYTVRSRYKDLKYLCIYVGSKKLSKFERQNVEMFMLDKTECIIDVFKGSLNVDIFMFNDYNCLLNGLVQCKGIFEDKIINMTYNEDNNQVIIDY